MITNPHTGTNVQEVARGIYRINTPITSPMPFSFNQYLVVDDSPLLFHTGLRSLFPAVREAIAAVLPPERLRYIAFSHFEADECGALNELLAIAPHAEPVCSRIGAMTSVGDQSQRAPRALADGDTLELGSRTVRWLDTPHVPHGWDSGLMFDESTRTLFCGDLFTQGGTGTVALTESDILGPSERFRAPLDYFSHGPATVATIGRLADFRPATLACMHGSAWQGDGSMLLRALADALAPR